MQLSPQMLELSAAGILIHGPQGAVLLQADTEGIRAHYRGDQLVNGSAARYVQQLADAACALAQNYPLPWTTRGDGSLQITQHSDYYAQSFSPQLAALETLRLWLARDSLATGR